MCKKISSIDTLSMKCVEEYKMYLHIELKLYLERNIINDRLLDSRLHKRTI